MLQWWQYFGLLKIFVQTSLMFIGASQQEFKLHPPENFKLHENLQKCLLETLFSTSASQQRCITLSLSDQLNIHRCLVM